MLNDYGIGYIGSLALVGSTVFGCIAGMLGFFIVFRGYSLLVDVVCHATLPGTMIPYCFFLTIYPFFCMIGGMLSSLIAIVLVYWLQKKTFLKVDAILGIVVSFFFGLGLVLMTIIQKNGCAKQGLVHSLFLGNAGLYSMSNIVSLLLVGIFIISSLYLCFYPLYAIIFDKTHATVSGFITESYYDHILSINLILLASVGLLVMGSIVMSAALIIPPIFAKQVTVSFKKGVFVSSVYGALMGLLGTTVAGYLHNMPTGPLIAVFLGTGLVINLVVSYWFKKLIW